MTPVTPTEQRDFADTQKFEKFVGNVHVFFNVLEGDETSALGQTLTVA